MAKKPSSLFADMDLVFTTALGEVAQLEGICGHLFGYVQTPSYRRVHEHARLRNF